MRTSFTFTLLIAIGVFAQNNPGDSTCERFAGLVTEDYYVRNWIEEPYAPEGQQCITLAEADASGVSWHANWTWSEDALWPNSSPWAGRVNFQQKMLRDIESMPTTWEWSFDEGVDAKASASYWMYGDGGCLVMVSWYVGIWLQGIGDVVPNDGRGLTGEVVGTTTISNVVFDVHLIVPASSAYRTYLFVAQEDQTSFSGDLLEFLRWPRNNDGISTLGCVWGLQAGADVYGGDGGFETKSYSLEQNLV